MSGHDLEFCIAVVNKRLSHEERLAQAIDAVSGRTDLVRPLEVSCNADVANRIVHTEGLGIGLLVGIGYIPASDFRFAKVEP